MKITKWVFQFFQSSNILNFCLQLFFESHCNNNSHKDTQNRKCKNSKHIEKNSKTSYGNYHKQNHEIWYWNKNVNTNKDTKKSTVKINVVNWKIKC